MRDSGRPLRSICVFCGARVGADPAYGHAARETAAALADRGLSLVYGGGNVGLMGVLADAALARGVEVTGVIPRSMVETELAHRSIHRLITVESMHERKAIMARESDGVLALPGGVGTLDELFEAMTWNQLRIHQKPIGLLDVAGPGGSFYRGLLEFLRHAQAQRFILPKTIDLLTVGSEPGALLDRMAQMASALPRDGVSPGHIA